MSTTAHKKPGTIIVNAIWDDEADVWVATTEDLTGLTTEAASLEALRGKLVVMIPELLEANGIPNPLAA